jgi:hypothetical protein
LTISQVSKFEEGGIPFMVLGVEESLSLRPKTRTDIRSVIHKPHEWVVCWPTRHNVLRIQPNIHARENFHEFPQDEKTRVKKQSLEIMEVGFGATLAWWW